MTGMDGEVDLAARWLGGSVMTASDESFGEKESLLLSSPAAVAEAPRYGHKGQIVDGWETRRRRHAGHDWALIRLGVPGRVERVGVGTSGFSGNQPETCGLEAIGCEGYPGEEELLGSGNDWVKIVPVSPLAGDSRAVFPVADRRRFTHVRLSIHPDGGVACLRVRGSVIPDPRSLDGLTVDLLAQRHGGLVMSSTDGFYSPAGMLNRPGPARTIGEGWETRRRREPGHDSVVCRLAFTGQIRRLVVDTHHFKYNASAEVAAYGAGGDSVPAVNSPLWMGMVNRTPLQPDTRHHLTVPGRRAVSWLRLDAFPDGGLSRVRALGAIDRLARAASGLRWFNALPVTHATRCLLDAGVDPVAAKLVMSHRPLGSRDGTVFDWPPGLPTAAQGVVSEMLQGRSSPTMS